MEQLKNLSIVFGVVSAVVGGVLWLQAEFATNRTLASQLIDTRLDFIEEDTEQDAAWAAHYRRLSREGLITPGEQDRLDWLERSLEIKYGKAERLEQVQIKLKTE